MDTTDTPPPTPGPDDGQVEACRLVATDADGHQVDFADLVRAVYAGDADPDDYTVAVGAA